METITKTNLPLKLHSRGKVRDTYELGENLLMVSTDRISAFDVVFNEGIPCKGFVLNELSLFWFSFTRDVVKNHFVRQTGEYGEDMRRRSMIVRKAAPIPLECIVRGYLAGSGLKEYRMKGSVCGIGLPGGLIEGSKLPEPIFTPSTKASAGHDISVSADEAGKIVGEETVEELKEKSVSLYRKAEEYARGRGVIIADTKFEFGRFDDGIILIDEALTPDSSRFWPVDMYEPGRAQPSFDKQFLRDYLEGTGWNKNPPAPKLPNLVVDATSAKYIEAYEKITCKRFER
ncbi:MAG: phosphoribosylaminoimidazolesuccinocarboxamide synthase [Candidatus Micrarchaeota archaeon]|nr:phosphoribosylaminoimidazolesuccinocarboxamide synthase [Candidatus Micrarchaeota archaeon]